MHCTCAKVRMGHEYTPTTTKINIPLPRLHAPHPPPPGHCPLGVQHAPAAQLQPGVPLAAGVRESGAHAVVV